MADKGMFKDLVQKFDNAMLVTRHPDGQLRSRPMAIARVDADGNLWFATRINAPKVREILVDEHVNVSMQSRDLFLSLSGEAEIVEEPAMVDQLWKESWRPWFPEGPETNGLCLIRVNAVEGEYWDGSGMRRLAFYVEAGVRWFRGEKMDDPHIDHGRVELV